jgi:hypothetical protein
MRTGQRLVAQSGALTILADRRLPPRCRAVLTRLQAPKCRARCRAIAQANPPNSAVGCRRWMPMQRRDPARCAAVQLPFQRSSQRFAQLLDYQRGGVDLARWRARWTRGGAWPQSASRSARALWCSADLRRAIIASAASTTIACSSRTRARSCSSLIASMRRSDARTCASATSANSRRCSEPLVGMCLWVISRAEPTL